MTTIVEPEDVRTIQRFVQQGDYFCSTARRRSSRALSLPASAYTRPDSRFLAPHRDPPNPDR
jgi:hypothetical protein